MNRNLLSAVALLHFSASLGCSDAAMPPRSVVAGSQASLPAQAGARSVVGFSGSPVGCKDMVLVPAGGSQAALVFVLEEREQAGVVVFVQARIQSQRVDQTNVWSLWCFNGT